MTTLGDSLAAKSANTIVPGDGDPRHGTERGYGSLGCRCDECRRVRREASWRRGTRPLDVYLSDVRDPDKRNCRFWSTVDKTGECWLWTNNLDRGYGRFGIGQKTVWAHRYSYELLVGPIPAGLTLDHLCHNRDESCSGGPTCLHRSCVNPAHLEIVTRGVNTLRGKSIAAVNKRKTHCHRGHEFTPENTRLIPKGRACKTCIRENDRRRKARA